MCAKKSNVSRATNKKKKTSVLKPEKPRTIANNRERRAAPTLDKNLHVVVNGYHIEEMLGSGKHGACYMAYHVVKCYEKICIKFINNDKVAENEARNLMMATDLNMFPTFLFNGSLNGKSIIGMSLAHETVQSYIEAMDCDDGPLRFENVTTVRVLLQCMEGLRELCRLGIVHMDLKPDNILVTPPYGCGRKVSIQLGDFGMSTRMMVVNGKLEPEPDQPEYHLREMIHSSPTVHLRGGVHGYLEDIHQLLFVGLHMSGVSMKEMKPTPRLNFKKRLLTAPEKNLPADSKWMAPLFEKLMSENPISPNYLDLKRTLCALIPNDFEQSLRLRKFEQTMYLE